MDPRPADLLASIAAALVPNIEIVSRALTERILEMEPALAEDPAVAEGLHASVSENVDQLTGTLVDGPAPRDTPTPAAALTWARMLAQRDIPIATLLRAYRVGQARYHQLAMAEIAHLTPDADAAAATATLLSEVTFAFVDRTSEDVMEAYQIERDTWVQNRTAARATVIAALLGGHPVDLAEAERTLGYPLVGPHLGAVAWTDADVPGGAAAVERAIAGLAQHLGCPHPPLAVPGDANAVWAWLPRRSTAPPDWPQTTDGPVRLALGDPADGPDGFRLTHRQAITVRRLAEFADAERRRPVTTWAAAGPIALMCADREQTAVWVQATLGGLAAAEEAMERLRETLLLFLSNRSFTATAGAQHLHKNTIQYRVKRAVEALGRPLEDHRDDVELALRVCHWVGTPVLRSVK
ncbi:MAG TPA: helix-turn-helix domain-containing protein [Sporichthyaceae bacterium]|nr:helix-turn-helix domain-containing protein [Sporichthyaceae bacterium]